MNSFVKQKGSMLLLTMVMLTLVISAVAVGFKVTQMQKERQRLITTASKIKILIDALDGYYWSNCQAAGGGVVAAPTINTLKALHALPAVDFTNGMGLTTGSPTFTLAIDQTGPITVIKVVGTFNNQGSANRISGYMKKYVSTSTTGNTVTFFRNSERYSKDVIVGLENDNFVNNMCN